MEELDRVEHECRCTEAELNMSAQHDRYLAALLIEWWIVLSFMFGPASAALCLKPTLFRRLGRLCLEAWFGLDGCLTD